MNFWLLLGLFCATSVACAEQEVTVGNQRLRVVLDSHLTPQMVDSEWEADSLVPSLRPRWNWSAARDKCWTGSRWQLALRRSIPCRFGVLPILLIWCRLT